MFLMKARVYVSLKKSVLDPQGKTIHRSLKNLGYENVNEVRQGKVFEIDLNGQLSTEEARREIEQMAKTVLTNPIIEQYSYEIEG
ncbi:MAG: phosphoribosylformylglycinamidine synthase subunit PurS [Terriglobia bacterium]